jgi:hypothetical protein
MAPVGRWQNGKDLAWYNSKTNKNGSSEVNDKRNEEILALKRAENDAMLIALYALLYFEECDSNSILISLI